MKVVKTFAPAALAAAAVAACSTMSQNAPTQVEKRLASIMGADASTAVGVLGFPDEKRQGTGMLVYVWSSGRSASLPGAAIRMGSYATHGGGQGGECRVELSVDDSGRIAGYQWSGNDDHCSWVVQAFDRAAARDEQPQ